MVLEKRFSFSYSNSLNWTLSKVLYIVFHDSNPSGLLILMLKFFPMWFYFAEILAQAQRCLTLLSQALRCKGHSRVRLKGKRITTNYNLRPDLGNIFLVTTSFPCYYNSC